MYGLVAPVLPKKRKKTPPERGFMSNPSGLLVDGAGTDDFDFHAAVLRAAA